MYEELTVATSAQFSTVYFSRNELYFFRFFCVCKLYTIQSLMLFIQQQKNPIIASKGQMCELSQRKICEKKSMKNGMYPLLRWTTLDIHHHHIWNVFLIRLYSISHKFLGNEKFTAIIHECCGNRTPSSSLFELASPFRWLDV